MSGWGGCLSGQDVSAAIKENSLPGAVVAELTIETTMEGVRWSLDGTDAHWFVLDETNIRLNSSADKILDREVLGPVLIAQLLCYEDDILQGAYRVIVEILNENDNSPVFAENNVQSVFLSELTPVNSVAFKVQATDADYDIIAYTIDPASPDAEYFRIDLPNSGEVILSKPLDYEIKIMLSVTIYATETNTADRFNASIDITITVLDGDDQYPQFLPCATLFQDGTNRICTSPVYTANVTEGEEDIVLDFSPGPIYAVDGDKGLSSPLSYTILSGDDDRRFSMDRITGEVRMTQGVKDRLVTPVLNLKIMAYQDNDPHKYSIATVLVRVLAVNQFYPQFDMAEYHGFVTAGKSPASLVNTYGSEALILHVHDQDFKQGFNPMIYFTFSPACNHTDIYQVTQEGLLIAKTSQLKPKQKHFLEVKAVDQESGDAASAVVVVEVLSEGQSVPLSPLRNDRLIGCTVGKAFLLSMVFMSVLGCVLSLVMWLKRRHMGKRGPLERGCVAQGKHPNVSLRWFQLVTHHSAMPHMEEVPYNNEECGTCNPSFSFQDKPEVYPNQDPSPSQEPVHVKMSTTPDISIIPIEIVNVNNNSSTMIKSSSCSPTFHPATDKVQDAALPTENADIPSDANPDPAETQHNTGPTLENNDTTTSDCPDLSTSNDDLVDPTASPSSQSSIPCSHNRIASAEIDKPFRKSHVRTPPYSPLLSSLLHKHTSTPPPTPEDIPLKAMLIHIDISPHDTPPETPAQRSGSPCMEVNQPSTSLDEIEQSVHPDRAEVPDSLSEDRRLSTNSGNTQDDRVVGDEDDDGFLGDEDADKNSECEGELESDEEELLRVMARCNPVFITFSK
ncbi:protocadherin-15 [Pholidichthys leucotaenia]